ncbi:MAG: VOC family protein [Hyphomonadaceae bacterium]|nr:VOC family protein [Hyphomonadaceae bacterium]
MQLNQVTLPCTDLEASAAFYETLGLRRIVYSPPRYARFECPTSDTLEPSTLSIELVDGWAGSDWPLVYLETADLAATAAHLEGAGLILLTTPEMQSYLWKEADIRDPAGNRIRLFEAGTARRFPPWRIKSD